ncbi:Reverse transcriptase, RNA-dependent DNA polymerase [Corchorus capsularis]|uniref:Reverse transcriptase, RNA-dependent DNA polymerase n=1 Tax=Corchorus capsularis TaxID=210143 RepID=A0A1R3JFZ1_COCAP|nr:Reverse transcriptase, RNA-dependent DNA polymerase [Corchorus capsularis]
MTRKDVESSGSKSVPIIFQSEGVFNTVITLDETNYDVWSHLMEMHIAEREKLLYIVGKAKRPLKSEERYERWYADNQKVKGWLLMSMKPEIMKRYLRVPTAREIWGALSKAFYDEGDELRVFTLNQKAFSIKQGGKSLTEYYGELVEIFQELDHQDKVVRKDPDDVIAYQKSVERLRDWRDKNPKHRKKDSRKQALVVVAEEGTYDDSIETTSTVVAAVNDCDMCPSVENAGLDVDDTSLNPSYEACQSNDNECSLDGETCPSNSLSKIPHQSELPKKQLPERVTRGIPKQTYETEISNTAKYLMSNFMCNQNLSKLNKSFVNKLSSVSIPNNVQEALTDARWKAAMNEEMKSLQKNETWDLVECPPGKRPVGCRWVYSVKHKANGTIERFKARLVAKGNQGKITTLIVYVDDMVLKGNDIEEMNSLQEQLSKEFEMKDLGFLKYFLGIEVSRSKRVIFLSQRKYTLDLLEETGEQHMGAVMRILRYLKYAPGKGIMFAKKEDWQSVSVYTNADWAGAIDDRRSTSGYFTFVRDNLVTWRSKKHNVVARVEAEFRGMALGLCEAL